MNLSKILDKKEDYLGLKDLSPNNLYFNIAQKAATYITPVNNKNKINTSWNILGNKIGFFYGGDKVNLITGGKRFTGTGSSLKALEEALYNLFQSELKGEVDLVRPDSVQRTVLSDRNEFNKAKGTCFPSLYKSVAWDKEGKKNVEVLGSRSNAVAMTERQFENALKVPSFKSSNFNLINREGTKFYLNKGTKFIDFNSAEFRSEKDGPVQHLTVPQFERAIKDIDNNLGIWARTPEFSELSRNIDSYLNTAVMYKGKVYLVLVGQNSFSVKELI